MKKLSLDPEFVIYGIFDRRDPNRCRYCGQTTVGLAKRRAGHWGHAKEGRNVPISDWLRSRMGRRADVEFRILASAQTLEELNALEELFVSELRGAGEADLNYLPGGRNHRGHKVAQSTRDKQSAMRRNGRVASSVLNPASVLELRRLSCSGIRDAEVAEVMGVGIQSVGHVMRGESWGYLPWEAGTLMRTKGRVRKNLTLAEIHDIGLLLSRGDSVKSVAAAFSIPSGRISKYLAKPDFRVKYNLDSPDVIARRRASWNQEKAAAVGGDRSPDATITEDVATRVKEMLFVGARQNAVAAALGVPASIVSAIDRDASWKVVPWPIGPRRKPFRARRRA